MSEKLIMPKNVQSFIYKYGGIGSKEQDSAFWKEFRKAANAYANVQAKRICDLEHALAESRKLQSELAAVTEQLKAAQDGWHDEITKGLSELRRAESIYTKAQERAERAEEQRDRLKEAIRKHKFCDVELYEALQSINKPQP